MSHIAQRPSRKGRVLVIFLVVLAVAGSICVGVGVWMNLRPTVVEPVPEPLVAPPTVSSSPVEPAPSTTAPETLPRRQKEFVPATMRIQDVGTIDVLPRNQVVTLRADGVRVIQFADAPIDDPFNTAWTRQTAKAAGRGFGIYSVHTYQYGASNGRKIYETQRIGSRIVLKGSNEGQTARYVVTERHELVRDTEEMSDFMRRVFTARKGRHIVVFVCSGVRRGYLDWSEATAIVARLETK